MTESSVLLVEDEAVVARDLEDRLGDLGYDVTGWVTTAPDALQQLENQRPDVVLMDIRIRGPVDGIDAADQIRRRFDVPVVFVTALADEETLIRAKKAQPFGFVVKPFSDSDLVSAIEIAVFKHSVDRKLRERENWLATTMQSIGDAVVATDEQGRVAFMNPVAETLTGWTAGDALGRGFGEVVKIVDAESRHPVDDPVSRVLRSREASELAVLSTLVARSGTELPIGDNEIPISAAPIAGEGEELLGAVVVFRDISAKKASEEQRNGLLDELRTTNQDLSEQRGFLTTLFDAAPCSVAVLDSDYRIRMINRHFEEAYQAADPEDHKLGIGDVLGCTYAYENPGKCGAMDDCLSCQIHEPFVAAIKGKSTKGHRCTFEYRHNGGIREMSLLVSAAPLNREGQRMVVVIFEDRTELDGLRRLLDAEDSFAGIVGSSPKMLEIFETIREVADLIVPVMITGESGTGKELLARAIHYEGIRSGQTFVPVNCAALPDGLLESELFGHVKGAFTGAVRDRKGRFELADGGTIFLDEIGDLSSGMQVKLLRVLQEGSFERVGGEKTLEVDVRVVCATNRNLEDEVHKGRFREDLYYRLCVMPIYAPPLRDRDTDVLLIVEHILEKQAVTQGGRNVSLSDEVINLFASHSWPGNVRELQNALQYAFIKCKGDQIEPGHLPPNLRAAAEIGAVTKPAQERLTMAAVADALKETGGSKVAAARALGVSRATLYRFLAANTGRKNGR